MPRQRNHGVFLPNGSPYYYCRVKINKKYEGCSTRLTDRKAAIAFAKRWKRQLLEKLGNNGAATRKMSFIQAVDGFLEYKKSRGERQPYREADLYWLVSKIGRNTDIATIDNAKVAEVIKARGERSRWDRAGCGLVKAATITQTVVRPLSATLNWANKHAKIHLPDMPHWKQFHVEGTPRTRELSFQEELDLLPACGEHAEPLKFILLSGLRLGSALIKWEDVHREERAIRVKVKGGKTHEVRITPEIEELLDRAARHPRGEYVFTYVQQTKAGIARKPITASGLFYRFKTEAARCGIKNIVIHDLRRTAGARMYRATDNIYKVSKFLGHSKTSITEKHYVHIVPDDMDVAMLAAERYRQRKLKEALEYRQAA